MSYSLSRLKVRFKQIALTALPSRGGWDRCRSPNRRLPRRAAGMGGVDGADRTAPAGHDSRHGPFRNRPRHRAPAGDCRSSHCGRHGKVCRLFGIVAHFRTFLAPEEGLDGCVEVEDAGGGQRRGATLFMRFSRIQATPPPRPFCGQRPAQSVFADQSGQAQHVRADAIAGQSGDVGVAPVFS